MATYDPNTLASILMANYQNPEAIRDFLAANPELSLSRINEALAPSGVNPTQVQDYFQKNIIPYSLPLAPGATGRVGELPGSQTIYPSAATPTGTPAGTPAGLPSGSYSGTAGTFTYQQIRDEVTKLIKDADSPQAAMPKIVGEMMQNRVPMAAIQNAFGQAPDLSNYVALYNTKHQLQYNEPVNRPWTYDADVKAYGNELLREYSTDLAAYNRAHGTNIQPSATTVEQLPNSAYQTSLPAEHKASGGFFKSGFGAILTGLVVGFALGPAGIGLAGELGFTGLAANAFTGAVSGALTSTITGGNPLTGALTGGVGGVVSSFIGGGTGDVNLGTDITDTINTSGGTNLTNNLTTGGTNLADLANLPNVNTGGTNTTNLGTDITDTINTSGGTNTGGTNLTQFQNSDPNANPLDLTPAKQAELAANPNLTSFADGTPYTPPGGKNTNTFKPGNEVTNADGSKTITNDDGSTTTTHTDGTTTSTDALKTDLLGAKTLTTATTAGTALSRLFDGSATAADLASLAGTFGSTILGYLGAQNQTSTLKGIYDQQVGFGAPYRARLEESYAPGFNLLDKGGYGDSLGRIADISARSYAHKFGNPIDSPTAQGGILRDVWQEGYIPALNTYRSQNLTGAGMGTNTAGTLGIATAQAAGGTYNALGTGLAGLTNPAQTGDQQLQALRLLIGGQRV